VFPTTLDNDPHYNAAGALIAAQAIYDTCVTEYGFGSVQATVDGAKRRRGEWITSSAK